MLRNVLLFATFLPIQRHYIKCIFEDEHLAKRNKAIKFINKFQNNI